MPSSNRPNPVATFFKQEPRQAKPIPAAVSRALERSVAWFREQSKKQPALGAAPLTHVAFALDSSGSMLTGRASTIEGFNRQVGVVREGAKTVGRTLFTDVRFGESVRVNCIAASLDMMAPMTDATYLPDGGTPLYDALGETIAALLQTPEIDEPSTAVLVTLFTDGGENTSVTYTVDMLRALIERLEASGRWTFALIGPHGSVENLASMLAVKPSNVAAYEPSSVASREVAFAAVAGASATYMSSRASGMTQVHNLYDVERNNGPKQP
jgi:hypothetical protein